MSTVIGTVTLDRDLIWEDEYDFTWLNSSVENTIGGSVIVQEFSKAESGRPITLVCLETQGYLLKSTVDALTTLAKSPNATYALVITSTNGETLSKTVRFRTELDGGPVQFTPLKPRDGLHADTMIYQGSIYLMVV